MDILKVFWMYDCKPIKTPMGTNANLEEKKRCLINDIKRYQQMVGKLIYFTISRPDIAYVVNVVSQFMQSPKRTHLQTVQ